MQLARVIGTVVATVKNESLSGRTLLVIQTLNKDLKPQGKPMVAVDSVGAGIGELVFWCRERKRAFLSSAKIRRPIAPSSPLLTPTRTSRRELDRDSG